ncbi:MAG: hypothetical protein PVI23_12520 [Maricaulaceae bacterium]|jgi:hypothetical protein
MLALRWIASLTASAVIVFGSLGVSSLAWSSFDRRFAEGAQRDAIVSVCMFEHVTRDRRACAAHLPEPPPMTYVHRPGRWSI